MPNFDVGSLYGRGFDQVSIGAKVV